MAANIYWHSDILSQTMFSPTQKNEKTISKQFMTSGWKNEALAAVYNPPLLQKT